MVRKPNKTMIGLFLLLGSAVFVFILGVYVKRVFFPDNSNVVVMYFQESIKGLNVGSSVVFQGVEIGKVSRIDLVADMENLTFSIPVYVNLDVSKTFVAGQDGYRNRKEVLDALIKKGLRARLTAQNYLTGQLMIELAMLPETPSPWKRNPRTRISSRYRPSCRRWANCPEGCRIFPLKTLPTNSATWPICSIPRFRLFCRR